MNKLFIAASVLALSASTAAADTITINSIEDKWQNAAGPGLATVDDQNKDHPDADTVSWGQNIGNGQSSYVWNSRDVSFDATVDSAFLLGDFTHNNRTIGLNSSIISVELDFAIGTFESPSSLGAVFNFLHDETPNEGTCQYTSTTKCADKVTLSDFNVT